MIKNWCIFIKGNKGLSLSILGFFAFFQGLQTAFHYGSGSLDDFGVGLLIAILTGVMYLLGFNFINKKYRFNYGSAAKKVFIFNIAWLIILIVPNALLNIILMSLVTSPNIFSNAITGLIMSLIFFTVGMWAQMYYAFSDIGFFTSFTQSFKTLKKVILPLGIIGLFLVLLPLCIDIFFNANLTSIYIENYNKISNIIYFPIAILLNFIYYSFVFYKYINMRQNENEQ